MTGHWTLAVAAPPQVTAAGPESSALAGLRLTDLAPSLGLDFQQGAFHYGMSSDTKAMMGGGVCWLDYNNDGWQDLFVVNSYSSADTAQWETHGGLPRTALFENVDGNVQGRQRRQRTPTCRCRATAASRRISTVTATPTWS